MTNLCPDAPAVSRLSTHRQAVLVWTAVLPTLTTLQFVLGRALAHLPEILRPVVVATLAVPIVVYVLVPRLQHVAARLARRTSEKAPVMNTLT
jgi:antibiotic biosynthesis monooxygenase (ABM) superfamily enzyme